MMVPYGKEWPLFLYPDAQNGPWLVEASVEIPNHDHRASRGFQGGSRGAEGH